ncbi:MAG: aldo/keto reductase [Bacteroidales bacterium]|nr:aldo/keto reductase [Bacteroidales bacterium]
METFIKLSNGIQMPVIGYGVFQVSPLECERCVSDALSVGYRMIDTAQAYQNEEGVGNAIKKSGIAREDIFLVSKIWMTNYGYETAKESINESLRKLQTDYLDLMLLHQPFCDYYGAWQAMEEAYREGKLRAIGVSNFYPDHLIDLCANVEIRPMVNQVETHVFHQQGFARKYMDELGVAHMAWGPLAEGKNGFFSNETLIKIGEKYGKTGPQVALRYLMELGVIIIPKSSHKERMAQNLNLFDFELTAEDKAELAKLDTGHPLIMPSHHDPEIVKWFMTLIR